RLQQRIVSRFLRAFVAIMIMGGDVGGSKKGGTAKKWADRSRPRLYSRPAPRIWSGPIVGRSATSYRGQRDQSEPQQHQRLRLRCGIRASSATARSRAGEIVRGNRSLEPHAERVERHGSAPVAGQNQVTRT